MVRRVPFVYGLLGLPLLFLLFFGNQFLYLSGADFSDLTISHLPNLLFLRRAILEWGQIPLWSPQILSGYPFLANPLSGLFYPPGWLALLWPEAWMFNLLAGLHLVFGGVGMLLFLKQQGLGDFSSLFGGLCFSFMPKMIVHFGAGHISLVYAVTWTPWLLYLSYNHNHKSRYRYWPAVILSLIFFADVRWAAFAGLVWVGWQIWDAKDIGFSQMVTSLSQLILMTLLIAPQALPLLEFVRLSTRATLGVEDVFAFSLPPDRLLGLLFPEFGDNPEWVIYPGVITLTLALIGFTWPDLRRKTLFWWILWLGSVIYSLGDNVPGLQLLAGVPGISLLRVPPRAIFLAGMGLAVLASFAFDQLLEGLHAKDRRRAMRVLIVLFGVTSAVTIGVSMITGKIQLNFFWSAGLAGIILLVLGRFLVARRTAPVWMSFLLIGIALVDAWGVNLRSLNPRTAIEIYSEQARVAEFLASKPGFFRVFSPSYSMPQLTAARFGLELADGVDPMQLQSYVSFMEKATNVPQTGYSVTMPPFAGAIPSANASYTPDATLLARLNIRYIISEFALAEDGLLLVESFGNTRVYENSLALSRAWVQSEVITGQLDVTKHVDIDWTPNRIEVQIEGSGILVLSELTYPGWQVTVDGQKAEIQSIDGIFRGVNLPLGEHQVIFTFRPTSLYIGLVLFSIAVIFLLATAIKSRSL